MYAMDSFGAMFENAGKTDLKNNIMTSVILCISLPDMH